MPVLSTVAAACARAWGFTAGDLFAGAALALDFDETTTLDSRITFTRATSGTYFDSSGVLQTASSGAARFDHRLESGSWVNKGLLIEEQRTNLALRSEEFEVSGSGLWNPARVTITANDETAPDGNTTADAMFETTDNNSHVLFQTRTVGATTTYAFSVYVKANGRNVVRLQMQATTNWAEAYYYLTDQTITSSTSGTGVLSGTSIEDVGNGWYRLILIGYSGQTNTNITIGAALDDGTLVYTGDVTKGLYLWGAQLEAGAFPTSYIKTTTASVTRNADQASMTSTNFSDWYNATEGTAFWQGDTVVDPVVTGGSSAFWSISDNGGTERIQLTGGSSGSDNVTNSFLVDGNVLQANMQQIITPFANVTIKNAFALKQDDFATSTDGNTVVTDTSGTMPTVNRLYFGARYDGTTLFANGHIGKFYYWNTRKSNSFLQNITS